MIIDFEEINIKNKCKNDVLTKFFKEEILTV